jgi:hypothetical protein
MGTGGKVGEFEVFSVQFSVNAQYATLKTEN